MKSEKAWINMNKVIQQEHEECNSFFVFLNRYKELYQKAEAKQPYHINVIDELHANENAHSRILAKLLQQEEILESFIECLTEKRCGSFDKIKIESPTVTQETERIDLWIRDKTYAIIIENKIHYAGDQERQLERYIDKTREGFCNEQIYVVYLSPRWEEPDEQSWGEYKDEFKERYLNLSFSDDILLWLKEKVLPNVKLKDVFLRSAIEQYIDHLEGIFSLRTINNKMNMELQDFIKQELGLDETPPIENIAKLLAKQEEVNMLNNQINVLINEMKKEADKPFFEKWEKETSLKYPNLQKDNEDGSSIGVIVHVDGNISVRVAISYGNQFFCLINTSRLDNQDLPQNVRDKTCHLLTRKSGNSEIYKDFDRHNYDGVFDCFLRVINILTEK